VKKLVEFAVLSAVDFFAKRRCAVVAPETLLIIRPDALGDYILFRNFLKEIRQSSRFARFRITLLGNAVWRDLAETLDAEYIDRFIWLDRKRLHADVRYRFDLLREITATGYDTVVYPVHSRELFLGDFLVRAVTAANKIASCGDLNNYAGWEKRLADRWYSRLLPTSSGILFEFLRNREIVEGLTGGQTRQLAPVLSAPAAAARLSLPARYAVIVPGAGFPARRWPAVRFGAVAAYLRATYGITSFVTGAAGDAGLAAEVTAAASGSCADLTGRLSLTELAAVIAGAALVIANDTGPVHLAAAVGAPFVCVSDGHHLGRFHPYPAGMGIKGQYAYPAEVAAIAGNAAAAACYGRGAFADIMAVSVAEVATLVDLLMSNQADGRCQTPGDNN
jgi:ADP-heptose:LPS heptosyltransferase